MRKLFTFALIAGFLLSCTSSPDPAIEEAKQAEAAAKAKAEEHLAVVNKFLDAYDTHDFKSWRELCTEDYITFGPQHDAEGTLDDYISYMNGFEGTVDSIEINTIALFARTQDEGDMAGDYVFWWGTNSGYVIEAEKSFTLMIHTAFKMKDGKIEWGWDFWDTGDFSAQMKGDKKDKK